MSSQLMLSHVMSCQLTADQLNDCQLRFSQGPSSHVMSDQLTSVHGTPRESTPPLNARSRQVSGWPHRDAYMPAANPADTGAAPASGWSSAVIAPTALTSPLPVV